MDSTKTSTDSDSSEDHLTFHESGDDTDSESGAGDVNEGSVGVLPYQFEPAADSDSDQEDAVIMADTTEDRLHNTNW